MSNREELIYSQDAVTVWFCGRAELDAAQVKRYRALGHAPPKGQKLAWPDVRSHRPGYFPWHPDESEVQTLEAIISAVLRFSGLMRQHPGLYDNRPDDVLPMLPSPQDPATAESLEWRRWNVPPTESVQLFNARARTCLTCRSRFPTASGRIFRA